MLEALVHPGIHGLIHAGLLAKTTLLGTETAGHRATHAVHVSGDRAAGHASARNCAAGDSTAIIRLGRTLETTHSRLLLKTASLLAVTTAHSALLKTTGLLAETTILLAETSLRHAEATALRLETTGLLRAESTLLAHAGIHAVTTADPIIAQ